MGINKRRIGNDNTLNRYFVVLIFWLLYLSLSSQSYSFSSPLFTQLRLGLGSSDDVISNEINKLIKKHNIEKAHLALKVVSLSDNHTIYERNADDLMITASNVKLFTTATALCKLGPDFKFTTTLFYDGIIKNNVLAGDLIIESNGDPNISGRFYNDCPTAIFERWAEQLLKIGIKNITGNIILDDSAFDREYCLPSWPKDQLTYWYCAPISAISFNDNCIEVTVFLNRKTGEIEYVISPPTKYVNVSLDVVLDKNISESQIDFYRIPDTNNITISGKMSFKDSIYKEFITINNPPLFFGTVLKEMLEQKGIMVNGKILCVNNPYQSLKQFVKVSETQTNLEQIINVINQRSQNLYAEQVLKFMAYHYKGKGSFTGGLEVISDFLNDEVGITHGTYFISDGSGLSRENYFSTNQIIKLLSYLYRHKLFSTFRNSLNSDRWLPKTNKRVEVSIWAKTGHLKNVLCLSGYALNPNNNKTLPKQHNYHVFSLIINNIENLSSGLNTAEQFRDEFIKSLQNIK
jgi:D-alanyl-D-alanine carboxypeptidase/D-alanyl-D-alanine-endopeptidase (penicillin-binding protein 4)